jgi:hypothetical protein
MHRNDSRAILKGQNSAIGGELMRQLTEEPLAQVLEVLHVRFANVPQEEALQAGQALAIVGSQLAEEPVGLAAASCATVTDGGWAVFSVTEAGG